MRSKSFILLNVLIVVAALCHFTFAQEPLQCTSIVLTHWMTPDEFLRRSEIGRGFTPTPPPPAPVTNLAEFNYNEGVLISVSIKTAVHSLTVTPVVSCPQDSVMVLSFSAMAFFTF